MRIVYFGSDIFAVSPLEKLINSKEEICAVVTSQDKEKGRHLILGFSAVKEFCVKRNLKIIQPGNLKDPVFLKLLKDINPDLFIVAAYGKIVPKEVLSIPKIIPLNIHGSLLPKYRGAAPINWAIINGEKQTGVTIIKMNELMDAGEIISQATLNINDNDTADSLREKLSLLASSLLVETTQSIKSNKFSLSLQNKANASWAPKLRKSDGLINWNANSIDIHNKIRGLMPWPGSFTYFEGKILKIHQAEILPSKQPSFAAGAITQILPDAIVVATSDFGLKIKILQVESGKKLTAKEFISGYRIKAGDKFG